VASRKCYGFSSGTPWAIRDTSDAGAWKTFDEEAKPFIEQMDGVRQQLQTLMLRRARLPYLLRWI
jgi:hypothetical protein